MKNVAMVLHLVGVATLIAGIGWLVSSGQAQFVVVPIGSILVGIGSLLFDLVHLQVRSQQVD